MYAQTWEEFEKSAQAVYLRNPDISRYVMKYNNSKQCLCIKLTDDYTCIQYKTDVVQDFKKIEKFIANLMKHMTTDLVKWIESYLCLLD